MKLTRKEAAELALRLSQISDNLEYSETFEMWFKKRGTCDYAFFDDEKKNLDGLINKLRKEERKLRRKEENMK